MQRYVLAIVMMTAAPALLASPNAWAQTTDQTTGAQTAPAAILSPLQQAISEKLSQLPRKSSADRIRADELAQWYAAREFRPFWADSGSDRKVAADAVIYRLLTAYEDGLIPADYDAGSLFEKQALTDPQGKASFEVDLSFAVATYGQHLNSGRVKPNKINRELVLYPTHISANKLMDQLASSPDPVKKLDGFAPNTARYNRLKKHLLALRLRDADGGWTQVPEGETLKEGMSDPRVPALRQRLVESRDLPEGAHSGSVYDGNLVKAVKYYQWRTGLTTDGVVGPATLKQINIPVGERIRQVELNLERRRWMQAEFGNPYIFVNLADQVLKVVKDEKTILATVVQVGQPYHRTPVFTEAMEYLDFNPYWNVPYSIATKEYLPKLKRNPYALQRQNIRVLRGGSVVNPGSVPWTSYSRGHFPVRLRQDPGPRNALGRVKFMFPNNFNIYIHDTPSKSKFQATSRYFSHGCIRVYDPFKLAEVILGLQGRSRSEIDRIASSGKRKVVRLERKIPVHITYLTAWVNKDGSAHYRQDVYGRDKILAKALARE